VVLAVDGAATEHAAILAGILFVDTLVQETLIIGL